MSRRSVTPPNRAMTQLLREYRANQREIRRRVQWPGATRVGSATGFTITTTDIDDAKEWYTGLTYAPGSGKWLLIADATIDWQDGTMEQLDSEMRIDDDTVLTVESLETQFTTTTGTGQLVLNAHTIKELSEGQDVLVQFSHASSNATTSEVLATANDITLVCYPL